VPKVRIPSRIQDKLQQLPDKPGVYILRDRTGRVIYIGKASSLRNRVRWYFRAGTLRSADPKLRGLIRSVADLNVIVCRSEAEAALTEGRLIKDFRPRYNTFFRDDKRFLMLKVDLREPLPRFSTCRVRKEDGAEYFGPYPSAKAARAALDFVEKRFGLRKCRARMPGADERRHCLYETMRYCSAPCIGRISAAEYRRRVAAACRFLRGESREDLEQLRRAMEEAAQRQEFERAAALRDLWLRLEEVMRSRRSHVRRMKYDREVGLRGMEELQRLLHLPGTPRRIEAFDVSHISGSLAVGSMVCAEAGIPQPARYRRYRVRATGALDDTARLREIIRRRYARVLAEGHPLPDLVLVDGGLPQANAARSELDRLGLARIPVVGLAKRLEDLYLPGRPEPRRLPEESPALRVLQWLRDEAHRFALSFHRTVRARRLRDSLLDEIEGIGPERRKRLLQYFGGVEKIAAADTAEIRRVPGFGPVLAEYVKKELSRRLARDESSEGTAKATSATAAGG